MNCASFLPEIKLPRVEVDPIIFDRKHPEFYKNVCYIPLLSNLEGTINILIGTATLVATVAFAAFYLISLPLIIPAELINGLPVFRPIPHGIAQPISLLGAVIILGGLQQSAFHLIYGIIESIPVVGNLTLAFWNGKIRIIPT